MTAVSSTKPIIPQRIVDAKPEFFVLSAINRLNDLSHGDHKQHFTYLRSRIEEDVAWDENIKQSYIRRLNLREQELNKPPPVARDSPTRVKRASSQGSLNSESVHSGDLSSVQTRQRQVKIDSEVDVSEISGRSPQSIQQQLFDKENRKPGVRTEAERQEALLAMSGDMKGLAMNMQGVIRKDNQKMDQISGKMDGYISTVDQENKNARSLLRFSTLDFFKTMIMFGVSVVLFLLMVPFILSTAIIN